MLPAVLGAERKMTITWDFLHRYYHFMPFVPFPIFFFDLAIAFPNQNL